MSTNDLEGLYSSGGAGGTMTRRQRVLMRRSALFRERSPWEARWREISSFVLPFAGRFFWTERNKGTRTFNNIIDEEATRALDVLSAGMMSGVSSPARPWFRLATPDPDLMDSEDVKVWLAKSTRLILNVFARGNTYRALHSVYEELGAFNTAINIIENDFDYVVWNEPLTVGEYAIATDHRGKVNTMVREFEMTVEQIVEKFVVTPNQRMDWSVVSPEVKNLWDRGNYEKGIPVVHLIEPRRKSERDTRPGYRGMPQNMPWKSCYIELGQKSDNMYLGESGFKDFPVLAPRWHVYGGDVYGVGPGMKALGSIKQLQQEQIRKAQGIDYMARPPIAVPGELKGRELDLLPGGVNSFNIAPTGAKVQNMFDVRLDLSHLLEDIKDVRERIAKTFYSDLFLMVSQMDGVQPRNQMEISARQEEKLLMLGPVLERLHDELLAPAVDTTFFALLDAGALPPPPQELDGQELRVDFVSVLAQAQRAVGLGSIDRLLGTIGNVATASGDPSPWDKIDKDVAVERYADMLAVDPELIVADKNVAMIRKARADAAQADKMAAMAPELAKAAKAGAEAQQVQSTTAGAPAGSMSQFSGYAP